MKRKLLLFGFVLFLLTNTLFADQYDYNPTDSPTQYAYNSNTYTELGWTTIAVSETDVLTGVDIDYTWVTDSYDYEGSFHLESPNGTSIQIATAEASGTYSHSLSDFDGETMNGDWILWIEDSYGDGGHQAISITVSFHYLAAGVPGIPTNPSPGNGATGVALSGNLTWDWGADSDTYDLWYGLAGNMAQVVTGGTVSGASGSYTYAATGSTDYEWQVIVHNSTKATTNGPVWNFTSLCAANTTFPWLEDFEGAFLPICWSKIVTAPNDITQSATQDHTTGTGFSARFSSYSSGTDYNQYLFSVPQTIDAGYTQLSFWHRKSGDYAEVLEYGIGTTTNPGDYTWTAVTLDYTAWQETVVDLTSEIGNTVYIAFHYYGNFSYYVYLDDVSIDAAPSCPAPITLTETDIALKSAKLGWTEIGTATTWEYEYGVSPYTFTGTGTSTTSNPVTISGLTLGETYDWGVRADCGSGSYSTWVTTGQFTTHDGVATNPTPANGATGIPLTSKIFDWDDILDADSYTIDIGTATGLSDIVDDGACPESTYTYTGGDWDATEDYFWTVTTVYTTKVDVVGTEWDFTTACGTVTTLSEDFTSSSTPTCWGNSGAESWLFSTSAAFGASLAGDHTPGGGTNYAWIDGSSSVLTNELLTPFVDVSGFTTPAFEFYYFSNNTDNPGENNPLTVDFWDGAAWNNLLTYAGDDANWQLGLYNLSGYTITGDVQFRFVVTQMASGDAWYNDILVDDVSVLEYPTCPAPTAQTETNITTTSVDLGWTPGGTEPNWNIEWGPTGFTQGTGTMISNTTSNPYSLSGLTASTTFDWYVQADCDGGTKDESTWVGPSPFTTSCSSVSIPWNEGFEGMPSVGAGIVPVCMLEDGDWSTGDASQSYGRDARTGTNYAYTNYSADDWLFSPAVDLTAGISYDFSFWYVTGGNSGWTTLEAKYGTGQTSGDMTTAIGTPVSGPTNTTYVEYRGSFTPATTGTYYMGIHVVATSSPWYITFDDLVCELTPTCPAPTNLTQSNLTSVGADLEWDFAVDSFFDIYVVPELDPPPGPTTPPTVSNVPGNAYTWDGGTPSTAYDWYVRTDCDITFTSPAVDYFWMAMDAPGNLIPGLSGGLPVDDPGEDGTWYEYPNAADPWWNIWFYNGPLDLNNMKLVRYGFWIQSYNTIDPGELYYVLNWSNELYPTGTGTFPTPLQEQFIRRSPINGPIVITPGVPQWVELTYLIEDYCPEWVSIDLWGENIQILEIGDPPPAGSPLLDWWVPGNAGGILVHECLQEPTGDNSTWSGPGNFTTLGLPPANDLCANAEVVICDISYPGTTLNATWDDVGTCLTTNTQPGVWYVHTGTGTMVSADLCGTAWDTKMGVFEGPCASLVCLDGNDDYCSLQSRVDWFAETGVDYYILVHQYGATGGAFTLNIDCTSPATATWEGDDSPFNDWFGADNWDVADVPGATTDVTIPVVTNYPTIDRAAVCNDLTIQSTASGDGSLIESGNLTASGIVTAQRYISNGQWHGVSAPVSGALAESFYSTIANVYLKYHTESSNLYTNVTALTYPLGDAKGFMMWYAGASGETFDITGTLRGSTAISKPLTRTAPGIDNGWSFVGNPYTSAIDWDATLGWTKANVGATVYLYNTGNWDTWNGTVGTGGMTSGHIAMGQGFFVEVNDDGSTTGTLAMTNDVQTHNTVGFLKSQSAISELVRLEVKSGAYTDETVIYFEAEATVGYDSQFDAHKLFSFNEDRPHIYSTANYFMAINALPVENTEVPVDVVGIDGKTMTIAATEVVGFGDVFMLDNYTGIQTNLAQTNYEFLYDEDITNRFLLFFSTVSTPDNIDELFTIYSHDNNVRVFIPIETNAKVVIYNLIGQKVNQTTAHKGINNIPVYESGYYLVTVVDNNTIVTKKVFIK